jgi:flagellar hook-length control protein FliK
MPVAFHPPLAHAPDATLPARGKDDGADADLFAALLSSAGTAAGPAVSIATPFAAFTGKTPRDGQDDPRGEVAREATGTATLDVAALAAFAAAAGVDLAQLAQYASASTGASAARPDVGATAAIGAGSARPGMTARVAASTTGAAEASAGTGTAGVTTHDGATTRAAPSSRDDGGAARATARASTAAEARRDAVAALDPASTQGARAAGTTATTTTTGAQATAALAHAAAALVHAVDAAHDLPGATATHAHDDAASVTAATAAAPAPVAAPTVRAVAEPVGSPGFAPAFAEEVAHLVRVNAERAELHLHPAELGPVGIKLHIQDNQVSVAVIATDSQARDALQQALPHLRDALAQQGIALAEASVHDQPRRDTDAGTSDVRPAPPRAAGATAIDATPAAARPSLRSRLVDLYA